MRATCLNNEISLIWQLPSVFHWKQAKFLFLLEIKWWRLVFWDRIYALLAPAWPFWPTCQRSWKRFSHIGRPIRESASRRIRLFLFVHLIYGYSPFMNESDMGEEGAWSLRDLYFRFNTLGFVRFLLDLCENDFLKLSVQNMTMLVRGLRRCHWT